VNRTVTSSPWRSALRSPGAAGSFTSGGSGGPFFPHPAEASTSAHASAAAHGGSEAAGRLSVDGTRGLNATAYRMYRERSSFLTISASIFDT
jgi:hypothetical protein